MKKRLDQLTHDELEKVNEFIPFGKSPVRQTRILFPNVIGKGSVKAVQNIKKYVWNKIMSGNNTERENCLVICDFVWEDIPEYAREIDLELIK